MRASLAALGSFEKWRNFNPFAEYKKQNTRKLQRVFAMILAALDFS